MPRINHNEYCRRRAFLISMLGDREQLMGVLKPNQQWDVHAFFQPTKALTDQQLCAHRRQITEQQPSLPAKAGKLVSRLKKIDDIALGSTDAGYSYNETVRRFSPAPHNPITSVVLAEANVKKLALAFIDLARAQQREQENDQAIL